MRPAVGNARSTRVVGAADGSAGSTGAARVEGDKDLEGAAIELVDDAVVASPSVPWAS